MPLNGTDLITDIGAQKLNTALGSNNAVEITHVAIGDANGARYAPDTTQVALRNERAREPITSRAEVENGWRTTVLFDSDTPPVNVREIGFFDTDGDLIFLWAGLDVSVRQTGAIDYVLDHVLNLSSIQDGLVIINAPDDELTALSARVGTLETDLLTRSGASFSVDQVNGNDANPGTFAAPLASIARATELMVPGGQHFVSLLGNYHWTTRDTVRASDVIIRSETTGPRRQITFGSEATNRAGDSPGLLHFSGGVQIAFNDVDIQLAAMSAGALAGDPSIIRTTAFPRVKFLNVNFTLAGNADQTVVNSVSPQDLYVQNVTFPSAMAGRWITGVAAGALPSSEPDVRTNLASF